MQIGSLHITKAYFGGLELTENNAFIGTTPVIDRSERGDEEIPE